jgi:hypothetical protein
MPILSPAQAAELSNALVDAFNPATLSWVVRVSLGLQLYVITSEQQPLPDVVAKLLEWVENRGPGTLEALLRGAATARPANEKLRGFCQRNFPNALTALDSGNLVRSFNVGLQLLFDLRDQPAVRQTVGAFRADLVTTSQQIVILKKYKALHDGLHDLQMDLDAIEDALDQFRANPGNVRTLRMYALAIKRYADAARAQTTDLPTQGEENDWIDDFDTCIRDINDATTPTAKPEDRAKIGNVLDRLKEILGNARRINSLLVAAAAGLRLESFTQTMTTIAGQLRGFAGPGDNTLKLIESSTSVAVLRARIAGLVGEHSEWQVFNINLDVAAENSNKHQPQARMPKWPKFGKSLTDLCNAYPEANWSHELLEMLAKWIAATPSADPGQGEKAAGEIAFADFHRVCVYRYYDVDKELNDLCAQVIEVAAPMNTLLMAIQ